MRKVLSALLCALVTSTVLGLANPTTALAADAGSEAAFVSRINSTRAAKGAAPLTVYGELVGIARSWSDQMAAAGSISHNPSYASQVSANWTKLGENVGVGYDVDSLMAAFIASPGHYKNIVDPLYNCVGVGVSWGNDGRMYVTQNFMAASDCGAAPAPEPEPTPEPEPAPEPAPAPAPSAPAPRSSTPSNAAPAAAAEPAPAPAPVPVPVPAPPAAPARVATVLAALRIVNA